MNTGVALDWLLLQASVRILTLRRQKAVDVLGVTHDVKSLLIKVFASADPVFIMLQESIIASFARDGFSMVDITIRLLSH